MKIFLDIDGVLLTKYGDLAAGAKKFLLWAIEHHETYWISTRTRDGSHRGALQAFHGKLDPEVIKAIRPTSWNILKTDALPLGSRDWVWIDDEILHAERDVLISDGSLGRFIQINFDKNPDALAALNEHPIFVAF